MIRRFHRLVAAITGAAWSLGSSGLAAAPSVRFAERRKLGLIVFARAAILPGVEAGDVARAFAAELEPHTLMRLHPLDGGIMPDCGGKLSCMAERVRDETPEYLLIVSSLPRKRGAQLSITLLDVESALREHDLAAKSAPDWQERLEALVSETAVLVGPRFVEVEPEAAFDRAIARFVDETLRPVLSARGEWDSFGALEVSAPAGAVVDVDGKPAGVVAGGVLKIAEVPAGRHTVRIEHKDYLAYEAAVDVPRNLEARLFAALVSKPTEGTGLASRPLFWGGAVMIAAGAAVSTFALVRHKSDVSVFCFSGGPASSACSETKQFQTLGYSPNVAPTFQDRLNPSGVLALPLGYSTMLTGATWSLGALLFGDDGYATWMELGAGLAIGVLAYGLSAAFNGHTAF
jgi:PEGA domain-containing protein